MLKNAPMLDCVSLLIMRKVCQGKWMVIPPRLCSNIGEDANKNNCNMIQTSELFIKARYQRLKAKYFHEKKCLSVCAHVWDFCARNNLKTVKRLKTNTAIIKNRKQNNLPHFENRFWSNSFECISVFKKHLNFIRRLRVLQTFSSPIEIPKTIIILLNTVNWIFSWNLISELMHEEDWTFILVDVFFDASYVFVLIYRDVKYLPLIAIIMYSLLQPMPSIHFRPFLIN